MIIALGVIGFCIEALVRLLVATKTITYFKYRTALFSGFAHAADPSKATQSKVMQSKTMQSNAKQCNAQSKAKQNNAKQCTVMQNNAKNCKATQSNAT